MAEREPPPWLIQDVLSRGAAAVLVGASGVGKTFVALDLAFAVAAGTPWQGYATVKSPVIYILAEGAGGVSVRVKAWRRWHDIPKGVSVGIWFWDRDVQLATVANRQAFQNELAKVENEATTAPQLIIVDTLARCFVGMDENAAQDMGRFIAGIDVLRSTGATVLVLHHEGHIKGRERGSTALRGAADTVLHLGAAVDGEGGLVLRCLKQRETEPFDTLYLQLKPVDVGNDASSCIVDEASDTTLPFSSKWKQAVELVPRMDAAPMTLKAWSMVARRLMSDRTFWRMKKAACARGYVVEIEDGKVYRP